MLADSNSFMRPIGRNSYGTIAKHVIYLTLSYAKYAQLKVSSQTLHIANSCFAAVEKNIAETAGQRHTATPFWSRRNGLAK